MLYFNTIKQNYIKRAFKTELIICWKKTTNSRQFIKLQYYMDVKVTVYNGFICSEHRQTESWSTARTSQRHQVIYQDVVGPHQIKRSRAPGSVFKHSNLKSFSSPVSRAASLCLFICLMSNLSPSSNTS